ncbi:unnamed protein product [Phaedon cochleariae]|uniref:Uncharacterized protein n=1 Tax=Phaedon cochleariae TaxID=80249 RepID=A0A9N9WX46_PHACE|nr:unnamed protein product [Phaedon cochleariae]
MMVLIEVPHNKSGTLSKNNLRLVDINKIAFTLGTSVCNALPAFHAFTGCDDHTASFARKAELTPFKPLEKSKKFQEAFSRMGGSETLSHETIEEEYVCEIYGNRKLSSVNKARFEIFLDCYKPKSNQSLFGGIKNFEASRIPP